MVSNASEDFPDPDNPVMTVSVLRGISTLIFLRLCWRAPRTTSLVRPMIPRLPPQEPLAHSADTEARITFHHSSGIDRGQLVIVVSCHRDGALMPVQWNSAWRKAALEPTTTSIFPQGYSDHCRVHS